MTSYKEKTVREIINSPEVVAALIAKCPITLEMSARRVCVRSS